MELFNTQLVWDYLYEETTILNRNDQVESVTAVEHGVVVSVKHYRDCEDPYNTSYEISYLELLEFVYNQVKK